MTGNLVGMKALALSGLLVTSIAFAAPQTSRPRLVVVISIDQFRGDYSARFSDYYLPAKTGGKVGGINFLMEQGAVFTDAHYNHVPTATGPGHAVILTGSVPALTGIIENNWYSRETKKQVYCVEDPLSETVGGPSSPMSPRNLFVTTVGDELKMATNGKAKVVGIAFKDRAAILMAGHAGDTVIWFDSGSAGWVTSSFYAPSKRLPAWVSKVNAENRPNSELGKVWTPLLPPANYALTRKAPFQKDTPEAVFAHPVAKIGDWTTSAFGQEYLFDTVKNAISAEELGQDEIPDILAINLSTNDYIGHAYGPNSPEVMDITVRTDRLLSGFFNALESQVPGGLKNVTIVLTADHGVLPIVEEATGTYRLPGGRIKPADTVAAAETALDQAFGEAKWVEAFDPPHLYLNRKAMSDLKVEPRSAETVAADAVQQGTGIFGAYTKSQVMMGEMPNLPWAQRVTNGFMPRLGGDVLVLEAPGYYFGAGTDTGHGSAWSYDTHVPIMLSGFGIQRGVSDKTVSVSDIAPTLSRLLRIEQPSGNVGRPLADALAR